MIKYQIIGGLYRGIAKPLFFLLDPEFVHDRIKTIGRLLGKSSITRYLTRKTFRYESPALVQTIAGLKFTNPIGLSAGFDKDADLLDILAEVGFGLAEIGSVTLNPYVGNPKPRLFRLPKSKGLVVYYGLKNIGVQKIASKFRRSRKSDCIRGLSVAKTNSPDTATEAGGITDYFECLKYLEEGSVGDFYTINISCPNTFGGEPYTTADKLERLLAKVAQLKIRKPVFVKMPINLPIKEFDALLQVIVRYKLQGVVIGNLTKVRDPELIKDTIPDHIKGGISGKPTEKLSNNLIAYTYKRYGDKLVIIGVGGVFSAQDAYTKIKLGASLIQLITGMIYQGPQLIGQINYELNQLLAEDGYTNISQVIGTGS